MIGAAALGRKEVRRTRQLPRRRRAGPLGSDGGHGVAHQRLHGRIGVGQPVEERGVGTVLQEAPHQIGHQVLVRPHRRVDAAGDARGAVGHHIVVDRLAHAVQALELIGARGGRGGDDGGNGERVVRGELRHERIAVGHDETHAREPRQVRVHLARQHRIVAEPPFLRPFDLAVPVGALDEPHRDRLASLVRQLPQPAQHRDRALAVGLHGKPQALPAGEGGMGKRGGEQRQREVEPVLLLGIDGEHQAVAAGDGGQLDEARQQLALEQIVLAGVEAGMQGRELDRQPRARQQRIGMHGTTACRMHPANGLGGGHVAAEIFAGIGGGARPLAQHVVGEAVALGLQGRGAGQRLLDGAAQHEAVAQHTHGLAHGLADERLAGAADQALENGAGPGALVLAEPHHLAADHQAEGGRVDQQAVRAPEVLLPLAAADLLGDQCVHGLLVGDAQQRLGEAQQDDALVRAEPIFGHEGVDAAVLVAVGAGGADDLGGAIGDAGALVGSEDGALQQAVHQPRLVHQMPGGDLVARRPGRRRGCHTGCQIGGGRGRRGRGGLRHVGSPRLSAI
jgi:hypothetical protein